MERAMFMANAVCPGLQVIRFFAYFYINQMIMEARRAYYILNNFCCMFIGMCSQNISMMVINRR